VSLVDKKSVKDRVDERALVARKIGFVPIKKKIDSHEHQDRLREEDRSNVVPQRRTFEVSRASLWRGSKKGSAPCRLKIELLTEEEEADAVRVCRPRRSTDWSLEC